MNHKIPPVPRALRGWFTASLTQRIYISRARGRMLIVAIAGKPGDYLVMALASAIDAAGPLQALQSFFDDHAHDVVGTRKTLAGAKQLGARYAGTWLAGQKKIAPCACGAIEEIKPAKRRAAA